MGSQEENVEDFSLGKSLSSEGPPEKGGSDEDNVPPPTHRKPNPGFSRSSTMAESLGDDNRVLCTSERKALAFQKARRAPSEDPGWSDIGRKEPLRVLRSLNPKRSAKIIIKGTYKINCN